MTGYTRSTLTHSARPVSEPTFLQRARLHRGHQPPAPREPFDPARTWRGVGYAQAALDQEVERVRAATEGTRNHTLNRAAFALGQLVAGGELERGMVLTELTAAARAIGLGDAEIGATLASGLASGGLSPRRAPAPYWNQPTPPGGWDIRDRDTGRETSQVKGAETVSETDGTDPAHARYLADVEFELRRLRSRTRAELLFADEQAADLPVFLATLRDLLVDTYGLDDIAEPVPLVGDILYRDSLVWLIGRPGSGKSFIALDLAGSIGAKETWQGLATQGGGVLYLAAEGAAGVKQRVRAWESSTGHAMTGVHFLPVPVQAADPGAWAALVALVAELGVVLVVVDTQARVTVGMEENSATDMGTFVERLEELRRASGACVLVVHHQGRSGEHMRGSTALEGAANTVIRVTKDEDEITLECVKQKDAPEFDKIHLRLVKHGLSAIVSLMFDETPMRTDTLAIKRMMIDWWNSHETDWVSVSTLIESPSISKATFHRAKKPLENAHLIEARGEANARRYRMIRKPDHD